MHNELKKNTTTQIRRVNSFLAILLIKEYYSTFILGLYYMAHFRDNTWDANIWNDIVNNNEYGVRDPWPYNVIDIGGHIGSFSFKMLSQHNAQKVVVVEPNIENYNLLIKNLEEYLIQDKVIALNLGIGPPTLRLISQILI